MILTIGLTLGFAGVAAIHANAESILITDREAVSGSDYTDSPTLAAQLDAIFDGNTDIYRDSGCTKPVDTTLGTSPVKNNGVYMYVGEENTKPLSIGTSCWIYANGVYHTLFGESTGGGYAGDNSEKLELRGTGSRRMSYENFKAWGVRQGVGALIRAGGHSMILLEYTPEGYTILDGNGDGRGLVSISTHSWERGYSYVEYIIQPKEHYYSALYASGMCGKDLVWAVDNDGTLTISGTGTLTYAAWSDHNRSIRKVIISGDGIILGNNVFSNCPNLETIIFDGTAPVLSEYTFRDVSAEIWYPVGIRGWEEATTDMYGGEVNWVGYDMTGQKFHDHTPNIYAQQAGSRCGVCEEDPLQRYKDYADNTPPVSTRWK